MAMGLVTEMRLMLAPIQRHQTLEGIRMLLLLEAEWSLNNVVTDADDCNLVSLLALGGVTLSDIIPSAYESQALLHPDLMSPSIWSPRPFLHQ